MTNSFVKATTIEAHKGAIKQAGIDKLDPLIAEIFESVKESVRQSTDKDWAEYGANRTPCQKLLLTFEVTIDQIDSLDPYDIVRAINSGLEKRGGMMNLAERGPVNRLEVEANCNGLIDPLRIVVGVYVRRNVPAKNDAVSTDW